MSTALLFTFAVAIQNATRLVHRGACYGAEVSESALDSIGCAEAAAVPIEHLLTPDVLRCNDSHCIDRFGELVHLHAMNCTETSCTVTLHCGERLSYIIQAALVTAVGVIALIVHNTVGSTGRWRAGVQKNL
jgi:hypothetical protein